MIDPVRLEAWQHASLELTDQAAHQRRLGGRQSRMAWFRTMRRLSQGEDCPFGLLDQPAQVLS